MFLDVRRVSIPFVGVRIILIISVERYVGITHPFHGGLSAARVRSALTTNAVVGVVSVVPCLVYFSNEEMSTCKGVWPSKVTGQVYYTCIAVIFYIFYMLEMDRHSAYDRTTSFQSKYHEIRSLAARK